MIWEALPFVIYMHEICIWDIHLFLVKERGGAITSILLYQFEVLD